MSPLLASLAIIICHMLAPACRASQPASPTIAISNGTIVGSSDGRVDSFLGVPYAQPPTGALRLKLPQPIDSAYGTITATGTPTACAQMSSNTTAATPPLVLQGLESKGADFVSAAASGLNPAPGPVGESCLTLNVQRPSTANSSSKLPVVYWIYGGSFETGSTQVYDGSTMVNKSIDLREPVIFVAVNYRLAAFGFLAGSELQAEGSTNIGLRDQRAGLEWVAENIEAFGGDNKKVTIWGESAGSWSTLDQLVINGGDNKYKGEPLFRGAIMDSGSTLPANPVNSTRAQGIYDHFAAAAGCSDPSKSLDCLRALPYEEFLKIQNSFASSAASDYNSLNLTFLPRPDPNNGFFPVSPEVAIAQGNFAHVPIIAGNQEDEGTLFSLAQINISTTSDVVTYFHSWWPGSTLPQVQEYVDTYPDNPIAGSPYGTGSENQINPQFKRVAAIIGDQQFILTRRRLLASVASIVPSWSYLATYLRGLAGLGTFHGSDILQIFDGQASTVTQQIIDVYYVNFINYLDPNGVLPDIYLVHWPKWDQNSSQLLDLKVNSSGLLADDFRPSSYDAFVKYESIFRL